jgi:selenocysteine-specific elongation factor
VINPFAEVPSRRGIKLRAVQLEAYAEPDPSAVLGGLLDASPSGVNVPRFGLAFNLMPERITTLLHDNRAVIVDREVQLAVLKTTVVDVGAKAVEAVKRFHDESPQATGMEMADLRKQIAPAMAANVFAAVLRESDAAKKLEITGSTLRLPRHNATDNPADEKTWKALQPVFDAAGFNVPGVRALAAAAKLSEATTRDFLHRKAKAGAEAGLPTAQLVRVNQERFFLRATLAKLAAEAQAVALAAPGGQFTAAQFRDRVGVGRDLCIEVLECFDRLGITLRLGNARKMRKDYVTILGPAD